MTFAADEKGKLILRDGKLFVGRPEDSICACCKCCWEILSVYGCPAPAVTLSDSGNVSVTFQDSANCEPDYCKITDEEIGDKTPCNLPQGVYLTKKWVLKKTTSLKVKLIVTVSSKERWGLWHGGGATVSISSCVGSYSVTGSSADSGEPTEEEDPENPPKCPMKTVIAEETLILKPACWTLNVSIGGGWLGLNMKNASCQISFEFDGDGPEGCDDPMCSTVNCEAVPGRSFGACIASKLNTISNEKPKSISDCVDACTSDCQEQTYYCCTLPKKDAVLKECTEFKYRICDSILPPLELSDTGPYYPSKDACQQDDENDCRITFNCENYECISVIGHGGEYDNINDCRAVCDPPEKRYECNKNYECIESTNTDAPYETIEDCIADCEEAPKKYRCSPGGDCYATPDGEYNTYEDCAGDINSPCYIGDLGFYCCYNDEPELATSASCQYGPCETPGRKAFGPSSRQRCDYNCQKFKCFMDLCDIGNCEPDVNGSYITRQKCLQQCTTDLPPNQPDEDCGFAKQTFTAPGEYTIVTNKGAKRICIAYRSINNKPVKMDYTYIVPNSCDDPNGLVKNNFGAWIGKKDCACPDLMPPGFGAMFDEVDFRKAQFIKPLGVKEFVVKIYAPCPESEFEVIVECGRCQAIDGADPNKIKGGCCAEDPEDGIIKCLAEMVTEAKCREFDGRWFGSCIECDTEDDKVDCETDFWACCDNGNCQNMTETQCDKRRDAAPPENRPFVIFYRGNKCIATDNPTGLQEEDIECPLPPNRGACCFQDWKKIGIISTIDVVDNILVNGIPIVNFDIIYCPVDSSGYPCTYGSVNVEVTKKQLHILSINLNAIPGLSPAKFPTKTVVTDITLPYSNCTGTSAGGGTSVSTQVIPLNNEMYVEIYQPPMTLLNNTSNISVDIIVSSEEDLYSVNTHLNSIAAVVENGKIIAIYTNYSNCLDDVLETDCGQGNPADPFGGLSNQLAFGKFAKQKRCTDIDCDTYTVDVLINKVALLLNMEDIPNTSINNLSINHVPAYQYQPRKFSLPAPNTQSIIAKSTADADDYESGPGTELKKLLKTIGITATKTCSCNSRAKTMDKWGPDICEQRIEEILGWLREEAAKRKLPFIDMVGKLLIKRAIRNARKKL